MKKATLISSVTIAGVFAFICVAVDQVIRNTGKAPRKPHGMRRPK